MVRLRSRQSDSDLRHVSLREKGSIRPILMSFYCFLNIPSYNRFPDQYSAGIPFFPHYSLTCPAHRNFVTLASRSLRSRKKRITQWVRVVLSKIFLSDWTKISHVLWIIYF